MTCIAVLKDNDDSYYMRADNITVWGNVIEERVDKVCKYENLTLSVTGSMAIANFIEENIENIYCIFLNVMSSTKKVNDIRMYLINLFDDNKISHSNDDWDFNILVIFNNKIYFISNSLHVMPVINNYYAIGAGREIALGALRYIDQYIRKEECFDVITELENVIKIVSDQCIYVGV